MARVPTVTDVADQAGRMAGRVAGVLEALDLEFRRLVGDPARTAPAGLLGVEQEFSLRVADEPVDFRGLIHDLPVRGRRMDPGDPNAYRLSWGGSLTSDGREAEVATPPVPRTAGFARRLALLARLGQEELEDLLGTLPAPVAVDGYSTHVSVAMPRELNAAACRLYTRTFAPALMLLMDRADSPGLIVRPRPGRTELCGEFVAGSHLRAVSAFAAGSVRACADAVSGLRSARRRLPPRVRVGVAPATIRYGWYVERRAFGPDLYADDGGRGAILHRRRGGTIRAQDQLALAWEAARGALGEDVDPADVAAAEDLVRGVSPLPVEGGAPDPETRPEEDPAEGLPFRELITVRDRPRYSVRPALATWDVTVFELARRGRTAFACVPRDSMQAFVRGLPAGRFDGVVERYIAVSPAGRTLAAQYQTGTPGLYDGIGVAADLLPEEQRPGAGAAAAGAVRAVKHHGNGDADDRGRRPRRFDRWRPRPWMAAAVAALVAAGALTAVVVNGKGRRPEALATSPMVTPSPTPSSSPSPSPTTSPDVAHVPANAAPLGPFRVTIRVLSSSHINSLPAGTTFTERWTFAPDCDIGACGGTLRRKGDDLNAGSGPVEYVGGREYSGRDHRLLACIQQPSGKTVDDAGDDTITFSFHVVKGHVIDGVWQASRIAGTMEANVIPTEKGRAFDCPVAFAHESITGVRVVRAGA